MKKIIFVMMLLIGILSFAGQAGINEYSYTQNYSTLIATNNLSNRTTGANNLFDQKYVTGQPGYAVYNYIQGRSSIK